MAEIITFVRESAHTCMNVGSCMYVGLRTHAY